MGRKAKWKSGETVAIRVPKALESQVMAYARALDKGGVETILYQIEPSLSDGLKGLVDQHRGFHEGHPDKIKLLRYSPDKHLNRLGAAYNHIQFHLTGHETNPTNAGIFAVCRDVGEQDLILWMILAEVLEGLERTSGGSVHWEATRPQTAIAS